MSSEDKNSQIIKKSPESNKKRVSVEDVMKKLNDDQRFDKTIKGKDSLLRKWIRRFFNR